MKRRREPDLLLAASVLLTYVSVVATGSGPTPAQALITTTGEGLPGRDVLEVLSAKRRHVGDSVARSKSKEAREDALLADASASNIAHFADRGRISAVLSQILPSDCNTT